MNQESLGLMRKKTYNKLQCQNMIKTALNDMGNDGYNFCYSSRQNFEGPFKQMKRNGIHLSFKCFNCINNGGFRIFTSKQGTVSIFFQFRNRDKLLIFHLRIYKMECSKCKRYRNGQIYDSQLVKIQDHFCQIIADIWDRVPPRKPEPQKQKLKLNLPHHKHDSCQACKLGKCHPNECPQKD